MIIEKKMSVAESNLTKSNFNWRDNLLIPGANGENEKLQNVIRVKETEITTCQAELSEYKELIKVVKNHINNISQSLKSTQQLCIAKQNELETEQHLQLMVDKEMSWLQSENRKLQDGYRNLQDKCITHRQQIVNFTKEEQLLSTRVQWDQEAAQAWLEHSAELEESLVALLNFSKEDAVKVKKLQVLLERNNELCVTKRRLLASTVSETFAAQIILANTIKEFRSVHKDRQNLLQQWDTARSHIERRDESLDVMTAILQRSCEELRNNRVELKNCEAYLETQLTNNVNVEKLIRNNDRNIVRLKQDYDNLVSKRLPECQGSKLENRRLLSDLKELGKRKIKQQNIIDELQSTKNKLEARIDRATADKSPDVDKQVLESKSKELQNILAVKKENNKQLEQHIKLTGEETERIKRGIQTLTMDKREYLLKNDDLSVENDVLKRQLKSLINDEQNLTVDASIVKLRIKRLQEKLDGKRYEMFNLEKEKLELETVTKERKEEVSLLKEMQLSELRSLNGQINKLNSRLVIRKTKIQKLKNRYEVTMMVDEDTGKNVNEAYAIIKSAQQKQELRQENAELEEEIRQLEIEIDTMENNFKSMKYNNEDIRKQMNAYPMTEEENELKESLCTELKQETDKCESKFETLRCLQQRVDEQDAVLEDTTKQNDLLNNLIDKKCHEVDSINSYLYDQSVKINRINRLLNRYKLNKDCLQSKDVDIRYYKDLYKRMARMIICFTDKHRNLSDDFQTIISEVGLTLEALPSSTKSTSKVLKSSSNITRNNSSKRTHASLPLSVVNVSMTSS